MADACSVKCKEVSYDVQVRPLYVILRTIYYIIVFQYIMPGRNDTHTYIPSRTLARLCVCVVCRELQSFMKVVQSVFKLLWGMKVAGVVLPLHLVR